MATMTLIQMHKSNCFLTLFPVLSVIKMGDGVVIYSKGD